MAISSLLIYIYKDEIIYLATMQINKRLNTRVDVAKEIDVSIFEKFPELSIGFHDVKVYEPHSPKSAPFSELKNVYLTFDLFDIWDGKYIIKKLFLEKGYVHLRTDPDGTHNFNIIKSDSTASGNASAFSISFIQLKEIDMMYDYKPGFQVYNILSDLTEASLTYRDRSYIIQVHGDWHSEGIYVKDNSFFKNKHTKIITSLVYNEEAEELTIRPSSIAVEQADYRIEGFYSMRKKKIDLSFKSNKSDIHTLTSILPAEYTKSIQQYESTGNMYFEGSVKGSLSESKSPDINVQFGFENAEFYHPEYKQHISKAFLKGNFSNGNEHSMRSSSLKLSDIHCLIDNKEIKGFFYLTNLDDPHIDTHLSGSIDLQNLLRLLPSHPFENASGELSFDIEFKGRSKDLKTRSGYNNIYTTGDLGLNNIAVKFKSYPHTISVHQAMCSFNKNDVSVTDMDVRIGKNEVVVNGFFRNLIGKIIYPDQAIYIQADLEMGNIFLEEILNSSNRTNGSSDEAFILPLLKDYKMELTINASSMNYKKFHANKIYSTMQWNYPLLTFNNSSLLFCGGAYTGNTYLKVINEKLWEIKSDSKIRSMHLDSLFIVFENFSQTFITHKNLKGEISSDISIVMQLDNKLSIHPASIICDADITIQNGELNQFEPMKKAARFLDASNLDNIKFSELKNHFLIYNQEIQIPEMTIRSNVGDIGISGKHSFDGHIEYHLAYPVKNIRKEKIDSDAAFGAVRQDAKGEMKVFLIIQGTTSDFKIIYDKKKTQEKIKTDIQKEKEELKALFKRKEEDQQQIKQTQQQEEEYFDF